MVQLTKKDVSPKVYATGEPLIRPFLEKTNHTTLFLNMVLDTICQNFSSLDASNHLAFIRMLNNQEELFKC